MNTYKRKLANVERRINERITYLKRTSSHMPVNFIARSIPLDSEFQRLLAIRQQIYLGMIKAQEQELMKLNKEMDEYLKKIITNYSKARPNVKSENINRLLKHAVLPLNKKWQNLKRRRNNISLPLVPLSNITI